MSYAFRKDGLGFRAIASAADVGADEVFNQTQPFIAPPEPTPLQQIRAAEAALDDYMRKASRIATLESALDKAMLLPIAAGLTRAEARAVYRQANTTFRLLDDLEIFCESERKKIV